MCAQVETMQSEIWSAPKPSAAPRETPRADAEDLLEADPEPSSVAGNTADDAA